MSPPPRPLPELIDDTVYEILLRIPPDEPAHLVRAALVCKPWRRILSDRHFFRRYRAFHRASPLLGFLQFVRDTVTLFVPSTAVPRLSFPSFRCKVLDCRHGRALLHNIESNTLDVWDPILGNGKKLAFPTYLKSYFGFTATVLCAADGCDHLDCRSGPFFVVFVGCGTNPDVNVTFWVSVYSSETGAWSAPTLIQLNSCTIEQRPGLLIGDALYFTLHLEENKEYILKYDLADGILSAIEAPYLDQMLEGIVITTNDGGLGFAGIKDTTLFLWSWNVGPPDDIAGWVPQRAIELLTLLPMSQPFSLIGFAEGTDTIFVKTNADVYTIELKSEKARKVVMRGSHAIVPYMSFYTPDLVEATCQHLKNAVVCRLYED